MEFWPSSHSDDRPEFGFRELNYTTLMSCLRKRGARGFYTELDLIKFRDPILRHNQWAFDSDPSFNKRDSSHANMIDHHNFLLYAYYQLAWTSASPPIHVTDVADTKRFQLDKACNFRVPTYPELIWLLYRHNYPELAYNGHFYRVLTAFRLMQHGLRVGIANSDPESEKKQLVLRLVISRLGKLGAPW